MGNNQNKPGARNDGGASEPKLQSVQPVAKKTGTIIKHCFSLTISNISSIYIELPPPVPILQPADIVISATQGDEALVAIFKSESPTIILNYEHNYKCINFVFLYTAKIQSAGYSVFSNTSTTDEAAKTVGKLVVDAKVSQLEILL